MARPCSQRRSASAVALVIVAGLITPLFASVAAAKPDVKPKPTASSPVATATAPTAAPTPTPTPTSTPVSATDESEAKRHFDIGLKLYKEKVFEAALTEFATSYKLNARPSALRNVAQCNRDLTHFAAAHDAYEQLLAAHGTQLSAKEKDAVNRAIADLKLLTGTITFTVNEEGAAVQIDGKPVGTTPLPNPVRVDLGLRHLKVFKAGFEAAEKELTITAQMAATAEFKLEKDVKTGRLAVKEEKGAEVHVWIDDVDVGPAPWSGELSPGSHVVELKGPKVAAPKKAVEVVLKKTTEISIEATPLRGKLRVETLQKESAVLVDGKKVGTGTWEGDLPPGTHEVTVVADGYEKYVHLVAVNHGQTVVEAVTLVRKSTGQPGIVANPKEAYIGTYARFSLLGAFSLNGAGDEIKSPTQFDKGCEEKGASCDLSKPLGAGAMLNVGYSFDFLAVEFVGAFSADFHRNTRTFNGKVGGPDVAKPIPPNTTISGPWDRTEKYEYLAFAGFAGIGGRITSKDDAVRFTFGTAIGAAYRSVDFKRLVASDEWKPGSVGSFSPAIIFDAGLLLGDTPGTKFTIGIMAWVELAGSLETADGGSRPTRAQFTEPTGRSITYDAQLASPPQSVLSGLQFYIGPTLGLRFGR